MEFADEMQWDPEFLLHIVMDGPNGNLKFQEDLKGKFKETWNKTVLDMDTCAVHKVYTSFKKAIFKLSVDVDQFAVNFHTCFKLSSARRKD